jgi:omega-6 fatty acid desaturase / acyl-lipid omega-6 desaturase (Delta-12 desaturase)
VPYHSWRISHSKHHAATAHLTQDQVFVPATRSQLGLPKLDTEHEDVQGTSVSLKMQEELMEAIGDSPLVSGIRAAGYLIIGWPAYLIRNASGQKYYKNCNRKLPMSFNVES